MPPPSDLTALYEQLRKADAAKDTAGAMRIAQAIRAATADTQPTSATADTQPTPDVAARDREIDAAQPGFMSGVVWPTVKGSLDAARSLAGSAVATPIAGLAGAVATPFVGPQRAAGVVDDAQRLMSPVTAPWTDAGRAGLDQLTQNPWSPLTWIPRLGNAVGDAAHSALQPVVGDTASAGIGALMNGGINVAPMLFGAGVARAGGVRTLVNGTDAAALATKRAQQFVRDTPGMPAWDQLSARMQENLKALGAYSGGLEGANLDPVQIARQARFDALDLPYSRADVTRNVRDVTREQNLSKTEAGGPLQDKNVAQDEALTDQFGRLYQGTKSTAETRRQIGEATQEPLRAAEASSRASYQAKFTKARQVDPNAMIDVPEVHALLDSSPELQDLGFVKSWMKRSDVRDGEPVNAAELMHLRTKASGIAQSGNNDAYSAGLIVKALDESLEAAAPTTSAAWQDAIQAFKEHKRTFENREGVRALVQNKGQYSLDRQVPLEDTFDRVMGGSTKSIDDVVNTLGPGSPGHGALKGAAIIRLRELSTQSGGRTNIGLAGQQEVGLRGIGQYNEWLKDGKIDALGFSPAEKAQLSNIMEAINEIRSPPSARVYGSSTWSNALNSLDSMSMKMVGNLGGDALNLLRKMRDSLKEESDARKAVTTPSDLDRAAPAVRRRVGRRVLTGAAVGSTAGSDRGRLQP